MWVCRRTHRAAISPSTLWAWIRSVPPPPLPPADHLFQKAGQGRVEERFDGVKAGMVSRVPEPGVHPMNSASPRTAPLSVHPERVSNQVYPVAPGAARPVINS